MRIKTDVQNTKPGSFKVDVWEHDPGPNGGRLFHTVDVECELDDSNIRFELVLYTTGITPEEEAAQLRQIGEALKRGAYKCEDAAAKLGGA